MLDIEKLGKLSDEEKCSQFEMMETPVCYPGFLVLLSSLHTPFPQLMSVSDYFLFSFDNYPQFLIESCRVAASAEGAFPAKNFGAAS